MALAAHSSTLGLNVGSIELLYEAHPCLAVYKPGALLTQAPPEIDSLELRIRQYLTRREQRTGKIYLGMPHRIDRPASGVLVVARNIRATRRLSQQFAMRTVQKTYWVLVEGHLRPEQGTWRDFMRKIPGVASAEIVAPDHAEARLAILHYRVRRYESYGSWLEIQLETGRTHQIRLQCAMRGHPVLGDHQYGSAQLFGPSVDDPRKRWIGLHARQLAFDHPKSHERVVVTAPVPKVWETLRKRQEWEEDDPSANHRD